MAKETRFTDNFQRLLGLHKLTAKRAAALLEVTPVSVSRWLNGHREPDADSLWRISMYFLIDPSLITDEEAKGILDEFARPERFEAVERQIADGVTFSQLDRESQMELRRHLTRTLSEASSQRWPQHHLAAQVEDDPVQLLARALAAVALNQQPAAARLGRAQSAEEESRHTLQGAEELAQALTDTANETEQAQERAAKRSR